MCQIFEQEDSESKNISIYNNVRKSKYGNLWHVYKNVHMAPRAMHGNSA